MRFRHLAAALLVISSAVAQNGQSKPSRPPDAPYVDSPYVVVDAMLKLAGVKKSDTVYDLGCGDGRIVIAAAKHYGAHGVGIEINPDLVEKARGNARRAHVEALTKFEVNDIFEADIHNATVVTLFMLPNVNVRLRPKLLKDLKPGTRIVAHKFGIGDWKPDREETVDGTNIYLWTVPEPK
ncbi:MAG TPA: class I SAM-dependent methyltransferase [Candidatus Acidoferrales bacterium]|jgi:cyclopropane fatty-acyl-phospholipid synthase-like methyltransferase|nr:class I SAM-dependent methyltransferase [Candidatus Acidoferrales bacterium]